MDVTYLRLSEKYHCVRKDQISLWKSWDVVI